MQAPNPHPRELERLAALRALRILDTPPEPRFDALTRTACRLFGVPTALISLVDENRQWFKSRAGLNATETPRDISFCGHAILNDEPFVIEDALRDQRFLDNPLVAGDLGLRFYAGAPLHDPQGLPLGTLCLIGYQPRAFTQDEREALIDLAILAESELTTNQASQSGSDQVRLDALIASMGEGVVFQDGQGVILSANAAAEEFLGLSLDQMQGRSSIDPRWQCIHEDGTLWPGDTHPAMEALRTGKPCTGKVMGVRLPNGGLHWILINAHPLLFDSPTPSGVVCSFQNISDRKRHEETLQSLVHRQTQIAAQVPGMIYQFRLRPDGSSSFPYASEGIAQIYGVSPEDVQKDATPALERIHSDDRSRIQASVLKSASNLAPWQETYRVLTEQGTLRWVLGNATPEMESDGSVLWHGFISDITDQKIQQVLLEQQEAFQRAMFLSAPVAIISTDLSGIVTSINPYGEDLVGYRSEELVGQHSPALWHDPQEVVARAEQLTHELGCTIEPGFDVFVHRARRGELEQREWTFITKEGLRKPVLLSVSSILDSSDTLVGFLGAILDLTEQKRTEANYRLLAEHTEDIIAQHTLEGAFSFITPAAERVLGYVPEFLLGRFPTEFVHEEDHGIVRRAHAAALKGEPPYPFRYRVRHREGHYLWLESLGSLLLDPLTGAPSKVLFTSRDITAQEEAERALRQNEERLRALLHAMPDLIFLIQDDGTILEVHSHDESGLRARREDLVGHTLHEVMPSGLADDRLARIRRVLSTGSVETYEAEVDTLEGKETHETRVVPCGTHTVLLIARDISERKAMERMKSEFVSTVSHELRTPITSIRAALGLLLAGIAGDIKGQGHDLLELARANTERLLRLVNDILDFEKAQSGQLTLEISRQDLGDLVTQTVVAAGPYAAALDVSYAWEAPKEPAFAPVDPVRFQQIMANLLSNGAKYSNSGGVVRVRLLRDERQWRVEVENQGPPIPPAFRAHIFERFAMADASDTRSRGGTGLGLAISRALVERMEGSIGFTSDAHQTCFHILLPSSEPKP